MPITEYTRKSSIDEIVAEMDRRGSVIESLEAERDRYLEALKDIDAVGVDFGHFESAARTMKQIATSAMMCLQNSTDECGAPIGAIENGREFFRRLEDFYNFECEAGKLSNCTEFMDARGCFEALAQWVIIRSKHR